MYYLGIINNINKILKIVFQMEMLQNKYLSKEYELKKEGALSDIESTLKELLKRLSSSLSS